MRNSEAMASANGQVAVGAGMVPAAFAPIAKDYNVTKQQASYLTTSYTLLGGLTPLLLTPYVNMYGRRPAYLVCESF
jgi:MFS family permease